MDNIRFDFTEQNFVVAGASSGIGRAVAREIAIAGGNVLAIARRKQELEALQRELPESRMEIADVDVTDLNNVKCCLKNFVKKHGPIQGSVYSAGSLTMTPIRYFDLQKAKEMMNVNFWAGIQFLQLTTSREYAFDGASHVQISSVASMHGEKGLGVYGATKAAIQTSVRTIAQEVANRGHRVNSVCPGWVETDMTTHILQNEKIQKAHLLGIGLPQDVSGVVLFLLSNRARWITGTNFIIDGGYLA